jgi:hypothetical protein
MTEGVTKCSEVRVASSESRASRGGGGCKVVEDTLDEQSRATSVVMLYGRSERNETYWDAVGENMFVQHLE